MATIYGYGEDSLTYWVLASQRAQLLANLGDDTEPGACKAIYRPSFGRAGGPTSSQFGEFDAILQTVHHTYLIESKWDSAAPARNEVVVNDTQILRHRIFQWIRQKWSAQGRPDWVPFVNQAGQEFIQDFGGRTLANPGTLLARNCQQVLLLLQDGPLSMRNVLLYFTGTEAMPRAVVDERLQPLTDPFQLCVFNYASMNNSGYFPMANA